MIDEARNGGSCELAISRIGEPRMDDQPRTWHYGLIARWWAEFNEADPTELAFYQSVVERDGQPALDLARGTGRLLLPLLNAGLDVDGRDVSPDMLALCRDAAARQGLTPRLFQQAMHELELPRAYRTIYICDSYGLGGSREQDANGDEIELRARVVDLDPMEQQLTLEMRAELWRKGRLEEQEERLLKENLYFRNEILLLLANVGFVDVSVRAGYSAEEATADDAMLVFIARK